VLESVSQGAVANHARVTPSNIYPTDRPEIHVFTKKKVLNLKDMLYPGEK
jgi:hypothetical protein